MESTTQMELLKSMTDEEDDTLLSAALSYAAQAILNAVYPYGTTETACPERYHSNQLEIAAYLLNKRGAEGQLIMSENGIYRSFESASIPASMFHGIVPFAGAIR